jgi:hypothetical protein
MLRRLMSLMPERNTKFWSWGVISSKGDVIPLHFFETEQRFNTKQYM